MKISAAIKELYPNVVGVTYWLSKVDGSDWDSPKDGIMAKKAADEKMLKDNWGAISAKADLLDKKNILDEKIEEFRPLREAEQYANYDHNGSILKATESTQTKLANVSDIFNGLKEIPWFDIDDNMIALTHDTIREIKVGLYKRSFQLYAKEKSIIKELKQILTVGELEAFDIQKKWNA